MKRIMSIVVLTVMGSIGTSFAAAVPQLGWPCDKTASTTVAIPFGYVWPARGPARNRVIWRESGIDIGAKAGDRVLAAEEGIVKDVAISPPLMPAPMGEIVVEHKDEQGNAYTTFYHNVTNLQQGVVVGMKVNKGQYLADVADLGVSTHLHFGIRNAPYTAAHVRHDYLPLRAAGTTPVFPEMYIDPVAYLP